MNTEKITDKIKHLLAIAHDPSASPAEREKAMNTAHSWMLKHGIEVSHTEESESIGHLNRTLPGVYGASKASMLYFIAQAYKSFEMILHELNNTSDVAVTIAGPKAQLKEFAALLESILTQAEDERQQFMKLLSPDLTRSQQKKAIKSFYLGYGSKVADRVVQILEAEASEDDMKALILVSDKAEKYLHEMFTVAENNRKDVTVDSYAFFSGEIAGERAQLNAHLN